jgi:hypothetical protein
MPLPIVSESYVCSRLHLTFPLGFSAFTAHSGSITRLTSAPFRVTPSGAIRRVMISPCLSACRPSLLEPSYARCGVGPLLRWGYWALPRPQRGYHVPHRQETSGELASLRREPGTVSAESLTSADPCSSKDVSATFVPSCVTTLQPRLH